MCQNLHFGFCLISSVNVVGDLGVALQYDTACSLDSCMHILASDNQSLTLIYDVCYMSKMNGWVLYNDSNFVSVVDSNFRSFSRF